MFEATKPQINEKEKLSPLGRKVVSGFYASFRLSQGIPGHQFLLHRYLSRSLPLDTIEEEFGSIDGLTERLLPVVLKIKPPKAHKYVGDSTILRNLTDEWQNLTDALAHLKSPLEKWESANPLEPELLREILRCLVDDDLYNAYTPRYNRDPAKHDIYESILRTHVILGKSTGSDDFDTLCIHLKPIFTANINHSQNGQLIKAWTKMHPGQVFFPPETTDPTS